MISLTAQTPDCPVEDALCRGVFDLTGNTWVAEGANWLIAKPASILTIIGLGFLARWLIGKAIKRAVERLTTRVRPVGHRGEDSADMSATARIAFARHRQRAETVGAVLRSISSFVIFGIASIMIIAEFGVDVGPLLAGAGIVGVALGFGAQNMVKDFLAGLFIVFEDQYGIGDVVDLGDAIGTVEAVTLRVTRLRDVQGIVWYVRNGEVVRVGNQSQNWARTVLDVQVGYGEDVERVKEVLADLCHTMWAADLGREQFLEEPEVWGVERLEADGVAIRVAIKTVPLEQWAVARMLRERIKARFDAEGIEIPFPQRTVWTRHVSE